MSPAYARRRKLMTLLIGSVSNDNNTATAHYPVECRWQDFYTECDKRPGDTLCLYKRNDLRLDTHRIDGVAHVYARSSKTGSFSRASPLMGKT